MNERMKVVKKLILVVAALFVLSGSFLTYSIIKTSDFNNKVINNPPQNNDSSNGGQESPNNPLEGQDKPSNGGQEDKPLGGNVEDTPSNGSQEDKPLGGNVEDTPSNGNQVNPDKPSDNQDVSTVNAKFDNLKKLMSNNDYFDTIIKNGEKKSDYLTSSFVWIDPKNKYTPEEQMSKFKELFNIPEIENIKFEIVYVKYSYNDNKLSNTELRVLVKITNILTSSTFKKEYKISGFFNPFEGSYIASLKERDNIVGTQYRYINEINKHDNEVLKRYNLHPDQLGYGTWQWSWLDWKPIEAYTNYFKLVEEGIKGEIKNNIEENVNSNPILSPNSPIMMGPHKDLKKYWENWIKWCYSKMTHVANVENKRNSSCKTYHVDSWFFDGGKNRWKIYGTKDSKGLCVASCLTKFEIDTVAKDKKGNKATNNYNPIKRTIFVWFYFKNGWWKAV